MEEETPVVVLDTDGLPHINLKLPSGTRLRFDSAKPNNVRWIGHNRLVIIASFDTEAHGRLLHLSASYPRRLVDWPELMDIQRSFAPRAPMMMVLPRPEQYVNMHRFTLNLFQVPVGWLTSVAANDGPKVVSGKIMDMQVAMNGSIAILHQAGQKPPWEVLCAFRDAHYRRDRDVFVWWDAPGLPHTNLKLVHMAYTPVPWEGGFAVGVPGISPEQAARISQQDRLGVRHER